MTRFSARRLTYDANECAREALCRLLASVKSLDEMRATCRDLLTPSEGVMLMRRVRIARMLLAGKTYEHIKKSLGVGCATIKWVAGRLARRDGGFEKALLRIDVILEEIRDEILREEDSLMDRDGMEALMRKLPGLFWPELLVRDLPKHLRAALGSHGRSRDLKRRRKND